MTFLGRGRAPDAAIDTAIDAATNTATDMTTAQDVVDIAAEAGALVAGLLARPWGEPSPSVYETARLVALAPWLAGHPERLAFLVDTQRPDGGWGAHEEYALVPTLSATDAVLAELRRGVLHVGPRSVAASADEGLRALFRWSRRNFGAPLPDLPAIELIVPSLVASINARLRELGESPLDGLHHWRGTVPLPLPQGMDGTKLELVRSRLRSGDPLPVKLMHALEVGGEAAFQARGVRPTPEGLVGASPAATAAWLGAAGTVEASHPARLRLEAVTAVDGGPVPCATPITVFERGWVLSWLIRAGVPVTVPRELVASLGERLGPGGVAAGPGLPADADTTSVALYTLTLLGEAREPDSLWAYDTGTHFCTWQGEQGFSTTVNAHVLDAFGQYVVARPGARPRYGPAVERLAGLLRARQHADGSWADRWHASPYYATVCCALALHDFGGAESAESVRRAVRWVSSTQRADGSWGLWRGTAEETAYALQLLLLTGASHQGVEAQVTRGRDHLLRAVRRGSAAGPADRPAGTPEPPDDPPMWHDKDLYLPVAIVRAAVLGALHLARSAPCSPCSTSDKT
ncbi:prenyltransferase/squalene oxidase repeat-containing protein [Sphaerisporangium dianthi]|uniref:Prenyltransferase/squalene oxidase repeat-containing protein n=1 Tax=Sphaerisporangium dianthi TaxID=1436120 RepID=A0ABV9CHR4_9ACTN